MKNIVTMLIVSLFAQGCVSLQRLPAAVFNAPRYLGSSIDELESNVGTLSDPNPDAPWVATRHCDIGPIHLEIHFDINTRVIEEISVSPSGEERLTAHQLLVYASIDPKSKDPVAFRWENQYHTEDISVSVMGLAEAKRRYSIGMGTPLSGSPPPHHLIVRIE